MAETKELVIIGGPNGSGKTTFTQSYVELHPMACLNADEIARTSIPKMSAKLVLLREKSSSNDSNNTKPEAKAYLLKVHFRGRILPK